MRKYLTIIVVTVLLVAAVAITVHLHNDGTEHGDCSLCIAAYHQSMAAASGPSVAYPMSVAVACPPTLPVSFPNKLSLPADGRAPPA